MDAPVTEYIYEKAHNVQSYFFNNPDSTDVVCK